MDSGCACGRAVLDSTGLPAPTASGAGALPPCTLPACGQASDGLGHQRLPAPPKTLHRPTGVGATPGAAGSRALAPPRPLAGAAPSAARGALGCLMPMGSQ